jgi:hypothetical protein
MLVQNMFRIRKVDLLHEKLRYTLIQNNHLVFTLHKVWGWRLRARTLAADNNNNNIVRVLLNFVA